MRPHIRKKGEKPLIGKYKGKPRRWVVERTNSWHNRFRAILIRWERKAEKLSGFSLSCKLNHCFNFLIGSFETGSKFQRGFVVIPTDLSSDPSICGVGYIREQHFSF
nr:hypothetical protein [Leptospira weilii]